MSARDPSEQQAVKRRPTNFRPREQQRADLRDIDMPPGKMPPEGLVRERKGPMSKSGHDDDQVPSHVPSAGDAKCKH